jgi:hypothetical protein
MTLGSPLKTECTMTDKLLKLRPTLRHCNKTIFAQSYHPEDAIEKDPQKKVPSVMTWDFDIDRWVNEGGAILSGLARTGGLAGLRLTT